jgi:HAD domain in Swiss Army Knife RNA repair proteins
MVLFLNFDGVLHPNSVLFTPSHAPVLNACRHRLFENLEAFENIIADFPEVRLILNTWWTYHVRLDQCLERFPESVSSRVVGTILPHVSLCSSVPNRIWMATEAALKAGAPVLLVDHADARYPKDLLPKAFLLTPQNGLGDPQAIGAFRRFMTHAAHQHASEVKKV